MISASLWYRVWFPIALTFWSVSSHEEKLKLNFVVGIVVHGFGCVTIANTCDPVADKEIHANNLDVSLQER